MNIWYSYDPEDGYTTHETPEDAREAAEASLEYHRDRSTDGWHEDTINIEWGLLVPYGETRECNRVETPDGDFDWMCDYQIVSAPGDDPLETAYRKLERSTDWYQQRFNALRKWVKEEVEPLSSEVAHRYFAIVANGSPSPHESADWQDTIHGLTLRAEKAEQERDEARAEVERLRGVTPALPPFPPEGYDAPRYGIRWNGPTEPITVPMEDGYWTPWHLADIAIAKVERERDEARAEVTRQRGVVEDLEYLEQEILRLFPYSYDDDSEEEEADPSECLGYAAREMRQITRQRDEARAEVDHWKGAAREHAENLTAARAEIETLLNALASISVDEYETTSSASEKVHGHAKIARRAISKCRQLRTRLKAQP
jgi:hypothetical protein